jgi:hypothetical protein
MEYTMRPSMPLLTLAAVALAGGARAEVREYRAVSQSRASRHGRAAHLSLAGDASEPRGERGPQFGEVVELPEVGRLMQQRLEEVVTVLELLLEGRILEASEALAKGLVTRVVPDARVDEEARETAQRIAAGAPLVHRWHKAFLRAIEERRPLSAAERDEAYACFDTRDFAEGRHAFLAKEKPRFGGR